MPNLTKSSLLRSIALLVCLGITCAPSAWGAEPESALVICAERYAQAVQSHYETVNDFAANFEQKTQAVTLGNASLGADAPSTGTVEFKKPGKMRWRYTTPSPSQVISDGKTLWIYDEGAREAQRLPVTQGYLTGAALGFLLGDGKILETFDVSASTCDPDLRGTVELTLRPKQAASYEYLTLRSKPQSGEIASTGLIDLFGNRTEISFRKAKLNLDPPAETFSFEPPSDVQVIDLTSGR